MDIGKQLSELIKIASLSSHERSLADYLFTELLVMGHKPVKQGGNVVVRIAGLDPSKCVIFDAHMDTVSPGALSKWTYPPYGKDAGIMHDGKIYGLGASDDKASLAALLGLAKEFVRQKPEIDVWLAFVTGEETGGDGTRAFLRWFEEKEYLKKYTEISAVICEPTDMEEVRIGHRGNMNIQISSQGQSGHASEPQQMKKQAILTTLQIIEALGKLEKAWQKKYADSVLGKPTIAVTCIQGGDIVSPNKFPDASFVVVDVRTTPAIHFKTFSTIEALARKFGSSAKTIYNPAPPGHTSPNKKIVTTAKKLIGKIGLGKGSTDLCFFSEFGIPGIILGPGTSDIIHTHNEFAEIKKLEKGLQIYKKLVSLL